MAVARAHLRVDDDYPDSQITPYLAAAESFAQQFMNRRLFADSDALATALLAVPTALSAATTAHVAAVEAAQALADDAESLAALEDAHRVYRDAFTSARETRAGLVITDGGEIQAAILLMLGHLHANREDVATMQTYQLPIGARALLQPYRLELGV